MGRRRAGSPPPYLEHKASGQAYSTLGGKPVYHGVYGTPESRKNYQAFLREWEAASNVTAPARGTCKVGEVCKRFLDQYARRQYVRADGTETNEVQSFVRAFGPLLKHYGHLGADELRAAHLKRLRDDWRREGLARVTINRDVGRIVRAWRWMHGEDEHAVSAACLASLASVPRLAMGEAPEGEPIPPVDDEVVDATLPFLPRQVAAMVSLQRLVGMRPGEVCRMRGAELGLDGTAQLGRRTGHAEGVWTFSPSQHKNVKKASKKARVLVYALGPRAQELLRPWLRDDPDEYLFQPKEAKAEFYAALRARAVKASTRSRKSKRKKRMPGRCYRIDSYGHAVGAGVEKANVERQKAGLPPLPHWSPNQLRHAWVTRIDAAEGIERTSKAIGHSQIATSELYLERRLHEAAEVARAHG